MLSVPANLGRTLEEETEGPRGPMLQASKCCHISAQTRWTPPRKIYVECVGQKEHLRNLFIILVYVLAVLNLFIKNA